MERTASILKLPLADLVSSPSQSGHGVAASGQVPGQDGVIDLSAVDEDGSWFSPELGRPREAD